jgi:alcohol dehydrogenase (cytochrome c)
LIFTGELTGDLLALDARSGKVLLRRELGGPAGGGVVTPTVLAVCKMWRSSRAS